MNYIGIVATYTEVSINGVPAMLTMLCVDSDPQSLKQIQQDLLPLNESLKLLQADTLKDEQQVQNYA